LLQPHQCACFIDIILAQVPSPLKSSNPNTKLPTALLLLLLLHGRFLPTQ
jgi:hypothetical protein